MAETKIKKQAINTNDGMNITAKAKASLGTRQSDIANETDTLINLDTEQYDIGGNFNTTTHLFTVPVTGYYLVTFNCRWGSTVANKLYRAYVKAGSIIVNTFNQTSMVDSFHCGGATIVYLTSGTEVGLWCKQYSGAATSDIEIGSSETFLAIHLLSL